MKAFKMPLWKEDNLVKHKERTVLRWCVLLYIHLKSPGIATAAAQFFGGFAPAEAFGDGHGSGGCQDLTKIFPKHISQADSTLAVQTAGNYRAVAQNAEMIP